MLSTKLLKVVANNFKNCKDNFSIDFLPKSRIYSQDKEYELQEIKENLYRFNTLAIVGKNASGKTTALDLLDCCYSILGNFRVENKNYDYNNTSLKIYFIQENYIYKYETDLVRNDIYNKAIFKNEKISKKRYYKSSINQIYDDSKFEYIEFKSKLPEDISTLFFVLNSSEERALYFDSFGKGANTYKEVFNLIDTYKIDKKIFMDIVKLFDTNIKRIEKKDTYNYIIEYSNCEKIVSETELLYLLSSGTTKGILLYLLMVISLTHGIDLIVDEIETHFHKTLVDNMISLYKDKKINKYNASLIFSTHYCELLNLFERQDNILISRLEEGKISLLNMYVDEKIRNDILKSARFYEDTFKTNVDYNDLMTFNNNLIL